MDQQDGISRRDAVIGVSFLSVLLALLSATIVYRILEAKHGISPRASAPLIAEAPIEVAPLAATPVLVDGQVDAVAFEAPLTESATAEPSSAAQPTFVAPSAR
ncbi:hypothetical protein [Lacipirellula parvula]|uniref:Uncharacterized protein n=1 Tax=Lacipirellula parvula TaxID=2650471 RepID=A0A5K7X8W6_9BACT|nr:hypothetical protein [Lacipirellula parvula]BBO32968.1 hypothetical protein PLANPX_2580 [Lacipirellula parvula]